MAKKCEYCGSPYVSGANFCQSCGAPRYSTAEPEKSSTAAGTTADNTTETPAAAAETGAVPGTTLGSLLNGKTKTAAAVGGTLLGALLLGSQIRRTQNRRRAAVMQQPMSVNPGGRHHRSARPAPLPQPDMQGGRRGMHGPGGARGPMGRSGRKF